MHWGRDLCPRARQRAPIDDFRICCGRVQCECDVLMGGIEFNEHRLWVSLYALGAREDDQRPYRAAGYVDITDLVVITGRSDLDRQKRLVLGYFVRYMRK